MRRAPHDSAEFEIMTALVLSATVVIVPSFAPYNQVLLLPAVFLIVTSWRNLWSRNWLTRVACAVCALVVIWPWLASCGLLFASLVLPAASVQQGWSLPLRNSLALPVVVLGLLVLATGNRLSRPFVPLRSEPPLTPKP
jgi:hypothetical protein